MLLQHFWPPACIIPLSICNKSTNVSSTKCRITWPELQRGLVHNLVQRCIMNIRTEFLLNQWKKIPQSITKIGIHSPYPSFRHNTVSIRATIQWRRQGWFQYACRDKFTCYNISQHIKLLTPIIFIAFTFVNLTHFSLVIQNNPNGSWRGFGFGIHEVKSVSLVKTNNQFSSGL